jgi:putative salt-induced outer membrane protein
MKPARCLALGVLLLVSSSATLADVAQLRNGDRLTGKIDDSDSQTLVLVTDYAGAVKVKWSAIQTVVSDEPVFVTTIDKEVLRGAITPENSEIVVHTTAAKDVHIALDEVAAVRSSQGQAAYEKSLHLSILRAWNANLGFGLGLVRGNSQTTNLNTRIQAVRKTLSDKISLYESSVYSTNDAPGGGVTANALLAGARYDRNITDDWFGFGSGDFTHDRFQDLGLRAIYSSGLGRHLVNTRNTTLDALAGANYTRETYYSNPSHVMRKITIDRNIPGLSLGQEFSHQFGSVTSLAEHFYYYPDVTAFHQYRISFDSALLTKINGWLGWQVAASDRYVSNPPFLGTKPNDVIFSSGLNISFAH